jgi:hypothetical protein
MSSTSASAVAIRPFLVAGNGTDNVDVRLTAVAVVAVGDAAIVSAYNAPSTSSAD